MKNTNLKELKNISGIYQIKNIINGKLYIGSTKNLYKRYYDHSYRLKRNIHENSKLQNAFNKYGEENFIFEAVEFVEDEDKLLEYEQYWIDRFDVVNKGYNINPTSNNTIMTEETKKKISIANSGENNGMYKKFGRQHPKYKEVVCFEELKIYGGFHEIERLKKIIWFTYMCML